MAMFNSYVTNYQRVGDFNGSPETHLHACRDFDVSIAIDGLHLKIWFKPQNWSTTWPC
jgi:hypothetical protein